MVVPAPKPKAKPVALGSSSTAKPSSTGTVKLALTNPNATAMSYKLAVKTFSRVTLTPVGGGTAVTKTITLKRS